MHARIRSLLVGVLALAVATASTAQGSFVSLQRLAPDPLVTHGLAAVHHHGAAATHEHGGAQGEKQQHSSQNCCGLCVIISNTVPAAPCVDVSMTVSRVLYPAREKPEPGRIVVLDPGIPKQRV